MYAAYVAQPEVYGIATHGAALTQGPLRSTGSDHPPLSRRETEVLRWIAAGKSNGDIGTILGISPHTVDSVCRRLMCKLDTTSRTTAAVRGAQRGLLPLI